MIAMASIPVKAVWRVRMTRTFYWLHYLVLDELHLLKLRNSLVTALYFSLKLQD